MVRRRRWRLFLAWARRSQLRRKLTIALIGASIGSGIATFATMSGSSSSFGPEPQVVQILLYLDVVLLLLLGVAMVRPLTKLWAARRQGLAGSRLHLRLVMLFSLVAVLPAILVAVFSGLFLNFGIQAWFGERVSIVVDNSRAVAQAYLHEHQKGIGADVLSIAGDLNREAPALMRNPAVFSRYLEAQAAVRDLIEAAVVSSGGQILARTSLSMALAFDILPVEVLRQAEAGDVVLLATDTDDRVRALVKLDRFVDAYLIVGRFIDQAVVSHIEATTGAYREYKLLEKRRKGLQITFVLIFVVVAMLLLLASVAVGLAIASSLVEPIGRLVAAAERIRKGDLGTRVDADTTADEMGTLGRAFNRMAAQIENQQRGLLMANQELDERRRFTETVLTGVSAGVIGLDEEGRVHLPNRSASDLLGIDLEREIGCRLGDVVPEMADLLAEVQRRPERLHQAEIKLFLDRRQRTLLVRMVAEHLGDDVPGYVVTFDDITELQTAQRQAAWADVARRIAHEIKNPLTPIQLSAERLKRKYLKEIESDPQTFSTCTDTIVRQVQDIGRMVDEFSSFARMPEPSMKEENLSDICRQVVFLERNREHDVRFEIDLPDKPILVRCDTRQIRQALTNLLKNSVEAIAEREKPTKGKLAQGWIRLSLSPPSSAGAGRGAAIRVEDNGRGLPDELRDRLTEPYVTTRVKGTGLGLAIVRKIVEDHRGELILEDRPEGGAAAEFVFPGRADAVRAEAAADESPVDPMQVAVRLTTDGP